MKVAARARAIQPTMIRQITDQARPTSLHLGLGQPDLSVNAIVRDAIHAAVDRGPAPYTPNLGLIETREAVAARYAIDASEVMITCGVQEALAVSILGLVEPGDEVLVPDPGFPAYPNLVRAAGGIPVPYPLLPERNWAPDIDAIRDAASEKTCAIILNSPSNPTGGVHSRDDLTAIIEVCQAHDILWISDEIYEDFVWQGEPISPAEIDPEGGVRVGGLSKSHAMMGWRLGWMTGPAATIQALKPLHQHLVTCAPWAAQVAAVVALQHHEYVVNAAREVFRERRDVLVGALSEIEDIAVPSADGAFYLFIGIDRLAHSMGGSLAVANALLAEQDVVTIPGAGFGGGGEGYLRLAYTVEASVLREAADRINRFVSQHV